MFQQEHLSFSLPIPHRPYIPHEMPQRIPGGPRPAVDTDNDPVRHEHVRLTGLYPDPRDPLLGWDEDVASAGDGRGGEEDPAVHAPVPLDDPDNPACGSHVEGLGGAAFRHHVQIFFFVNLFIQLRETELYLNSWIGTFWE